MALDESMSRPKQEKTCQRLQRHFDRLGNRLRKILEQKTNISFRIFAKAGYLPYLCHRHHV